MKILIFDIECDNIDPFNPKLVGLGYQVDDNKVIYMDVNNSKLTLVPQHIVLNGMKKYLESISYLKVCHNLKFELSYLKSLGINMVPPYYDTMIAAWILNMGVETETSQGPVTSYKLKELEKLWFGTDREDFKKLSKRFAISVPTQRMKKDKTPMMRKRDALASEIPESELGPYCKADVEGTHRLYTLFSEKMTEADRTVHEREMKLIPIYEKMERYGVKMDIPYLKKYQVEIGQKLDHIQSQFDTNMNIGSTQQLGEFLYGQLHLQVLTQTKKKQPSTSKGALKRLARRYPEHKKIFDNISEYRMWIKYRSTYIRNWIDNTHPSDGRVHFSINPIGAHSGRISSPSQQIPKRTEHAGDVRKGIIAEPGYVLLNFDYSQIEPRIMSSFTQDPELIAIFNEGRDIYKYVAGAALQIPPDQITDQQRDIGKVLVLAINYGTTAWGLAEELNIPVEKAQSFLDNYFRKFPKVRQYQKEIILSAKQKGYIETIDHTRRTISSNITLKPEWVKNRYGAWTDKMKWKRAEAERQALNLPIQGSAADIIKRAMIAIDPQLHPSIKMILQIHDALLFEVPKERVKTVAPAIKQIMEHVMPLKVATPVSVSVGPNLGTMTKVEEK